MYRLEETEWMAELYHHDIIQAEDLGSSSLRFTRVAQRSELELTSGIFSKDFLDSPELLSELNWLTGRGGYWQRDMGGCLFLSVPKDVETDFNGRWDKAVDSYRRPVQHWVRCVVSWSSNSVQSIRAGSANRSGYSHLASFARSIAHWR